MTVALPKSSVQTCICIIALLNTESFVNGLTLNEFLAWLVWDIRLFVFPELDENIDNTFISVH